MNKFRIITCVLLAVIMAGVTGCGSRMFRHGGGSAEAPVTVSSAPPADLRGRFVPDSSYRAWEKAFLIASETMAPEVLDVFLSSDSVNCFHVMFADSVSGTFEVEPNFVRVAGPVLLDEKEIETLLSDLVLSPDAYGRNEFRIEARYFPFWEFEFVGDTLPTVSLLISPADRTWSIASEGKRLTNYDMPFPDRTLLFCESKLSSGADNK